VRVYRPSKLASIKGWLHLHNGTPDDGHQERPRDNKTPGDEAGNPADLYRAFD